MLTLLVATLAVLIASALCSGIEAALFSTPLTRVKQLAQEKRSSANTLLAIRENMTRPISTLVILNNVSNIVGSIVVGGLATQALGSKWLGLFSGLLTFLVIIFAEIIPKTLGEKFSETICLTVAKPLALLTKLFSPLNWLVEKITSPFTGGKIQTFTTNEAEIRTLAKIGQEEGAIETQESRLIQRVFELNDTTALEIMTPRVAITSLKANATLSEAKETVKNSIHSRLIIFGEEADDVIGVTYRGELLAAMLEEESTQKVGAYSHQALFVEEKTPADKLLLLFQESHQHIAIVVDQFAAVRGVVTLEDVLEILTGEIVDETDLAPDLREPAKDKFKSLNVTQ